MTPAELKYQYQQANPDGHFFDRKTMAFFGDTMANFGVRDDGDCWELYRRRPVKHGLRSSHWFDKQTFRERLDKRPPKPWEKGEKTDA
jgi:hypothetical protein